MATDFTRHKRLSNISGRSSVRKSKVATRHDRIKRKEKRLHKHGNRASTTSASPSKKQLSHRNNRFRLILVWLLLMLGGFGLVANLFRLQIIQGPELAQHAQIQQKRDLGDFVRRYPIVDRLGNVIATDQLVYSLYAHPLFFKSSQSLVADELAPILGESGSNLLTKFAQGETGVRLRDGLTPVAAEQIRNLEHNGLDLVPHHQRIYPQRELFANVVGYVDGDGQGQAGLEYSQQEHLQIPLNGLSTPQNGVGDFLSSEVPGALLQNQDLKLKLTLDHRLQRLVQLDLQQQVEAYSAIHGAVLVMDAQTGALRALVTEPTYDPNQYYEYDVQRFKNWALTDLYEPGSTFKPINLAIALEEGVIQRDESIYDKGRIRIGEWTIQNVDYKAIGARGWLSATDVLVHSSNVGMVDIVERIEPDRYYTWLEKLGLGNRSGTDLAFEPPSQLESQEEFTGIRVKQATAAFGQGFSLTPLQLLKVHGVLASGGKLLTPHVIQGVIDSQENIHWQPNLPTQKRLFSADTTQTILGMMEQVVDVGTGQKARIAGYRIAGKTGTSQKASPYGGYDPNARIVSFVGTFPADNPRYVVLAVIDEPYSEEAYGSNVAAPLVRSVIESTIAIEKLPITHPNSSAVTD